MQAARCLRRSPRIYDLLRSGKLTLCTLAEASKVMTDANRAAILTEVQGKSKREAERLAVRFGAPAQPRRGSIRPRPVVGQGSMQEPSMKGPTLGPARTQSTLTSPVEQNSLMEQKVAFAFSFELSAEAKELYEEARVRSGRGRIVAESQTRLSARLQRVTGVAARTSVTVTNSAARRRGWSSIIFIHSRWVDHMRWKISGCVAEHTISSTPSSVSASS